MTTAPAFANCHSHVFHRALRGRITGADSFWSWREQMYAIAAVLDPDLLFDLARATYAEMYLAAQQLSHDSVAAQVSAARQAAARAAQRNQPKDAPSVPMRARVRGALGRLRRRLPRLQ